MAEQRFAEKYIKSVQVENLRQEIAAKRRELEERRAAIEIEAKALEAQEAILDRLRPTVTPIPSAKTNGRRPAPPTVPHRGGGEKQARESKRDRGQGPTEAIEQALRRLGPVPQKTLVDELAPSMGTGTDARRRVTKTIWWMKKENRVIEQDGNVCLPEQVPTDPTD